jgi:hypothetical protein
VRGYIPRGALWLYLIRTRSARKRQ